MSGILEPKGTIVRPLADPAQGSGVLLARTRPRSLPPAADASHRKKALAAETFSHLASPPVMSLAAYLYAAAGIGGTRAWVWSWIHVAIGVLFPVVVLMIMVQRREVSHIELVNRRQRIMPLMFTLALTGYSLFLMEVGGAPALLRQLTWANCILLAGLLIVTRWWKISMHAAGVALTGAFLWKMTGSPVVLILLAVTMALARVYLCRHTPAQVLAGTALGIMVGITLI